MKPWQTSRLKRPRLAIVGCGDIGLRLASQLAGRVKILAFGRTASIVKGARFLSIDLDDRKSLSDAVKLARWVVYLAPPPTLGTDDLRMKHFVALSQGIERCVYISTTAVYGAAQGAWVKETSPLQPTELRGVRRIAAERRIKQSSILSVSILRAPGIYAQDRLPIERILKGLPALIPKDDVPTNHIHADDLARLSWLGLFRGRNRRAYNVSDGQPMMHGEYLKAVANAFKLTAPPLLPKEQVKKSLSPIAWSMLAGARQVCSERLFNEWRVSLRYPNVMSLLNEIPKN